MNKQYGFYFDSARCLKCYACEIACQQWHGIKAGTVKLRKVVEVTTGTFPEVTRRFLSLSCRHCAKAPCAAACPEKAITRRIEDGIVVVDSTKCIGCQVCLEACPFGVPQFDADGLMQKCDMCLDRLAKDLKPICAATCPTQALHWGTLVELSELASVKAAQKLISPRPQ
jgi:anaerobic dimethyl sulfoxide reductase subunit B (iron-sulfur subunit)